MKTKFGTAGLDPKGYYRRVNLEDLEREVKRRGLKWLKFEED